MEKRKVRKISAKRSLFMGSLTNISEKEDYMSVTEWENGEGAEVVVNDRYISLHRDELEGINYLLKKLDYEFEN